MSSFNHLERRIRLLIVDDHEVVRTGLKSLLCDKFEIAGEAADGDQAILQATKLQPDVILMDIRMPNRDGLSALEEIVRRQPWARVIICSGYDNPTYVARAIALGAKDYLLDGSTRDEFTTTIQQVAADQERPRGTLYQKIKNAINPGPKNDVPFTNHEIEVLRQVSLGLSNREIGRIVGISIESVKEHVQNILRKLGVIDRTQAALWAVRNDLV